MSFEDLSELEDYSDFNEYLKPPPESEAPPQSEAPPAAAKEDQKCGMCVTNDKNCVFVPCGHIYSCMECYEKWCTIDSMSFELTDDNGDIIDVPANRNLSEQKKECPYCKSVVQMAVQIRPT